MQPSGFRTYQLNYHRIQQIKNYLSNSSIQNKTNKRSLKLKSKKDEKDKKHIN